MSDDMPPRPLANLISEAHEGRLQVRMDPERFVCIDRDCEYFKEQIQNVQRLMTEVAQLPHWGLGDDYVAKDGKDLVSGKTMVQRYRTKAQGSGNGVYEVLDSHYQVVEDIQNMFREIRDRYIQQDVEWGAKYHNLEETLPPQPPAPPRYFTRFTSTGGV